MDFPSIPQRVPDICLVSPSPQLLEATARVCARKNLAIGMFEAVLDEALPLGKLLQERGAKILVSRKGTADLLSKHLDIQVVKINTTMNDYLRHIDLMREHKGRIGIVEYISYIPELKKLCKYIRIDALLYSYDSSENYTKVVKDAVNGDATILLGGGALLPRISKELRIPHTIVENTEENIGIALDVAMQLLNVWQEEKKKQDLLRSLTERYSAVLRFSSDAVIATDHRGIITVANPMALSVIEKKERDCVGRKIVNLFPQLDFQRFAKDSKPLINRMIMHEGVQFSATFIPILNESHFEGVVCTFHTVKAIQETEQKIRMQLHDKGHTAKYRFDDIIGKSTAILQTKKISQSYARSDSTLLLVGETGVGKELFAQSIHNESPRAGGPFVAINCASLGKDLLESQLFGYVEGAFTGAVRGGRAGLFEAAHGGTLFLDEIGEIPLETQTQLLRVLQEKEIRRVGSFHIIPVDVRVLCATNRDLAHEVAAGRFRRDLYYRINTLQLDIPPLRSRREDIPLLADHFLSIYPVAVVEKVHPKLANLIQTLSSYDWPGNIRELSGLVERITTLLEYGTDVSVDNIFLKEIIRHPSFDKSRERPGKDDIAAALKKSGGSRVKAAELLGISRSTLWRLMNSHSIS